MRARRLALAATLAVAALLLSGCQFLPKPNGSSTTVTTHTDEAVPSSLKKFYSQSLTWTTRSGATDSTFVTVPLSWDDPGGATIKIAVARHRAGSGKLGSLLINPGGPGGSGFDFVDQAADYVVTSAVLKKYDIIGFDPRGVGRSRPAITCYTDPKKEEKLL